LVALDGTQYSLTNTPQVKASMRKAKSRRGRAAFAKITASVLLELGLHNPLAAAIGRGGQSEWALAAGKKVGSHCLIRARSNVRLQTVQRFKDGSRRVRLPVRQKGQPQVILQWLELREIRVRVQRPGHRPQEVRLWTSLLDPRSAPAGELIRSTGAWPAAARVRSRARSALASTNAAISCAPVSGVWLCSTSLLRNCRFSCR
jgi:hypothetical protein